MDYLNEAKKFLRSGRDHSFNNRHAEATADLLSAIAAALIAIAERMDEPIDSHPADLAERAGKGECPRCGQVWFECTCEPPDYLKAALR